MKGGVTGLLGGLEGRGGGGAQGPHRYLMHVPSLCLLIPIKLHMQMPSVLILHDLMRQSMQNKSPNSA